MIPPHMSLKCADYKLKKKRKPEKTPASQMMCKRAGACGTACIQFQCTVFTSVSLLKRQPPGTSLSGLKGLSGFNDASERARVLFLHSSTSERLCNASW